MAAILITTLTPVLTTNGGCALGLPCILGHFGMFGLLGVAIAGRYASSDAARRSPRRLLLITLLALWLFAGADELAQEWWVAGRGAAFGDWLADMTGAVGGMIAGSLLLRLALTATRR